MTTRSIYARTGGRMYSSWLGGNMVVYPEGLGPATVFFVDANSGLSASGDGLSWERAFLTISEAMTAVGNLGTRGRGIIFVAPGGYTEDIQTPLNADGPFGQLIAVSPTSISGGAAWLASTAAATPVITVRARGWRISGFEIDSPTGAAAILLQRNLGNTLRSDWTEIDHNLIGATTTGKYGVEFEGAGKNIHIHHNDFELIQAANGAAIFCDTTPVALPLLCIIEDNDFRENVSHIRMGGSWGFNAAIIRRNHFQGIGDQTPTYVINIAGGRNNLVHDNFLGITTANYDDNTDGMCQPGTNDVWVGNKVLEGIMDENPAGG